MTVTGTAKNRINSLKLKLIPLENCNYVECIGLCYHCSEQSYGVAIAQTNADPSYIRSLGTYFSKFYKLSHYENVQN